MGEIARAEVRLTRAATDDLRAIFRHDPQFARDAIRKLTALAFRPTAGKELRSGLTTFRSTRFAGGWGRIVWRVDGPANESAATITVAEVWGLGAREDEEIYDEVKSRLANLPNDPVTAALADIVDVMGARGGRRSVPDALFGRAAERAGDVSPNLRKSLFHVVRMKDADIDRLTESAAQQIWDDYLNTLDNT